MPVLPAVPSTITPPGFRSPRASASRTMYQAARSLTEPPGLRNSALPRIVQPVSSETLRSLMSGVLPMVAMKPSRTSMTCPPARQPSMERTKRRCNSAAAASQRHEETTAGRVRCGRRKLPAHAKRRTSDTGTAMPPVDPIVASVIQHRLLAIVEEMGEAMLRTSYSQILNSSRDFSTAICDLDGRLIAQAEHVPIHVGALPWAARSVRDFFKGEIRKGDVFLLNDPYHGGNHLPDLTAFVPVFDGETPVFWAINRAHQSDIGGATHGAYNAGATEIWQEGIRITPLRLYEQGELKRDVMEMLVTNVRHPRDFRGDLAAMIGSARVGERRLLALAAEFGWETTHAAIEAVLDGAERQTRAVIAEWKDGTYRGEAILDDDGHRYRDVYIRARVEKRGSDLRVDLTDSHPQVA